MPVCHPLRLHALASRRLREADPIDPRGRRVSVNARREHRAIDDGHVLREREADRFHVPVLQQCAPLKYTGACLTVYAHCTSCFQCAWPVKPGLGLGLGLDLTLTQTLTQTLTLPLTQNACI